MSREQSLWMIAGALTTLTLGCGAGPVQLCKDGADTTCKRVYECYTEQERAGANFIALYGSSETECRSKLESNQCAKVSDSQPCTDSSKKYDQGKASACIDDLKRASCETIRGGTFTSGNCSAVCS